MIRAGLVILLALAAAGPASACAVCFGEPGSDSTRALMIAMSVLLGVTVSVLAGIALFGYRIVRRGRLQGGETV